MAVSAADAQHLAGRIRQPLYYRKTSASGNRSDHGHIGDYEYRNDMISPKSSANSESDRPARDILLGALSTSGNSANVLKGLEMAKKMGLVTVAFTGKDGGDIAKIVDFSINVLRTAPPEFRKRILQRGPRSVNWWI
jgi:D-sedoheptulose 7-phosphate isomerase